MKYYKLINGEEFIGVSSAADFRKFQQKHQILLVCDEYQGQYIRCNGNLYRDTWMVPESTNTIESELVSVIRIDEKEYKTLYSAIERNEEIKVITEPDPAPVETPIEEHEQVTIDYIRSTKINEMSATCEQTIAKGFDIELSDGTTHHFSLTEKDQLNLIAIQGMILSGAETIPYHADDELCEYYTAVDMMLIINKANAFKTYHVSYFNSLKSYINSLSSIGAIMSLYYGIDIPKKHQSKVLQSLSI